MTLARSLLIVLGAATVLAAFIGLLYGPVDALVTFGVLAVTGTLALAVAHAVAANRHRLGSLDRQLGLTGAIAVGQLVAVVSAGAALMFVSTHDALLALTIVVLAGIVGVRTAHLLAHGVLADIHGLRDTLVAVGDGAREPAPRTTADDELAELTAAANAAIARLAATEQARRDLVAAVSHDLRTPLTSLRLLAEAVGDGVVAGETREAYLGQIRVHVASLSALVDDLFELSRLEAGDMHWTLEQVRLDLLVGGTVEEMRTQAEARSVTVHARVGDAGPTAHANPERLKRVLYNLIQNAIRHTPADGSVTVSAEVADDRVEIEVADTGSGIPSEQRDRVFEPFYRGGADASRTSDGAGLGLAIARAIVEAHGGRIWLADAPAGTRVRFSLPRTPVPA